MADTFEFELYDHYPHEIPEVYEQIHAGNVPFDTLFRLAVVGRNEVDPRRPNWSLRWNMLQDIAKNGDDPAKLRDDTHEVLFGELPDLVVDFLNHHNRDGYPALDTMYYTLGDMADAVAVSRQERGVKVCNPFVGKLYGEEEAEWVTCVGDARKIWRLLIQRTNPAIINTPGNYCPATYSFDQVYYPGDRLMARRNIAAAVLSDTAVLRLYDESRETGIKGIARVGQEILQLLLIEEHPELCEGVSR